jgi:hypothetical protein
MTDCNHPECAAPNGSGSALEDAQALLRKYDSKTIEERVSPAMQVMLGEVSARAVVSIAESLAALVDRQYDAGLIAERATVALEALEIQSRRTR